MDRHDLVWNPWHGYGCRIWSKAKAADGELVRDFVAAGRLSISSLRIR